MPATSADKLTPFRIRLAPKGRRKPPPGPDIEGNILPDDHHEAEAAATAKATIVQLVLGGLGL
ncbi:MAG: hypothetical protein ACJ8EL_17885 [Rhizomicrobium sp.]